MTTQKLEYDSTFGGPVELPSHVPTYRYAAVVLEEIKQLLDDNTHTSSTKLAFQTLPKHMRRRAMSHHPKRLPRKYRAIHRSQMAKAGNPQLTKRPSRKYRRRPQNLLRDYLRRQRRNIWLETHIWHAKRFHMIDRWGYRLPYASCDKTFRACYRASAAHCLLQDISYHACIEIEGDVEAIRLGFERLTSVECGLSITAKTFLTGRREGSIDLFRDSQYPSGALGRVTFMWCPNEQVFDINGKRSLWLWLHPSAYHTLLMELIKVFELVSKKNVQVPIVETKKEEEDKKGNTKLFTPVKKQRRLQFMTKTLAFERIKSYANANNSIQLNELKDNFNRFRLTGPLAQSVLTEAFKPYTTTPSVDTKKCNWFTTLVGTQSDILKSHTTQANYWQLAGKLSSPSELLSNMIIGLNISDPRLSRPKKRTKATSTASFISSDSTSAAHSLLFNMPENLAVSALWQSAVRDQITEQMLATHDYCNLRAKNAIVPGAPCAFEAELQPLPVILIQRPGSQQANYKRLGYSCGWDIIAPTGYGMAIWLTLIMWGAKPGGLRECQTIAREAGQAQHLPDTVAAQQQCTESAVELQTKYFRLPPNKRCNYRKLSIVSPFRVPYQQLMRDWLPTDTSSTAIDASYYILRQQHLLQRIDLSMKQRKLDFPCDIPANCLIQVQLRMLRRGQLHDNALICLPNRTDFKRHLKCVARAGSQTPVYTEPLRADTNEGPRKVLRQEHKRLLKRLRAKRVREKRKLQETSLQRVHIRAANTAQMVKAQFAAMSDLWLPVAPTELGGVRQQCTRECFGYVSDAAFSFTEATVGAVGYVTPAGLRQLHTLWRQQNAGLVKQPMCLVRDTKSRHYRFATFKVNLTLSD